MPEYVRVRDKSIHDPENNHYTSVFKAEAEAHPDVYEVLKQPAVNENGDPLPGEIVPKSTTGQSATTPKKES